MNGEENGVEGRAFAHLLNGTSYELPWLGKFAWENSVANSAAGGTAEILVTAPATTTNPNGPKMMDNITINNRGRIIIQEDPGNQPYVAKIWRYDIATGGLKEAARHDPDRFKPGAAGFLTQDEESSGVIDASSILDEGLYLLVQQAFYSIDIELVEAGQLLALPIPSGKK